MMKYEFGGKIMTGFVALRAKLYAYRKLDIKLEDKLCKCTKKCVVAENLTFDEYNICLIDGKTICREQMLFEKKETRDLHCN